VGEEEDACGEDCGCKGGEPVPVFECRLWGEEEDGVEEAALAVGAGWWREVVEVFEESTAESAVMEMAGDLEGDVVGERAFLLSEKESEWGAFFLALVASGEDFANGVEHWHRQRAPEAARALVGTHRWGISSARAH
jgi:hypothetical protein